MPNPPAPLYLDEDVSVGEQLLCDSGGDGFSGPRLWTGCRSSDISRRYKFKYDLLYIKKQGFWLDLTLILISFWIRLLRYARNDESEGFAMTLSGGNGKIGEEVLRRREA